ncbi:periplasmic binding protein [Bdellovibrio bacteriovorus W]|nr:periplasmic binding protein [Bdellovibrio bacteriovorus W]
MKIIFALSIFISSPLFAATFTGVDGKKVVVSNPQRLVVINSSSVEIISALGKGEKIVGVDAGSQFPEEVTKKAQNLGHPYRPGAEGVISLKPDLVIANEENMPAATAEQIRSAKIQVLVLENSAKDGLEGLKRRVTLLGDVLEAKEKALELNKEIEADVAALQVEIKSLKKTPKIFFLYAHGPGTAFIYGQATGSHYLIEAVGGKNSADFTTGTKPLTAEAMVQASPDVIIMLGRGLKAVGGVEGALKLSGVSLTPAGKNKAILQVDDSIRWIGPRFPGFAKELLQEMKKTL